MKPSEAVSFWKGGATKRYGVLAALTETAGTERAQFAPTSICQHAAGIGQGAGTVIIFHVVGFADVADDHPQALHGVGELLRETAGGVGIRAFLAAHAGAGAHDHSAGELAAHQLRELLHGSAVVLPQLHEAVEIQGIDLAGGLHQQAPLEFADLGVAFLQSAAAGRTGPVLPAMSLS